LWICVSSLACGAWALPPLVPIEEQAAQSQPVPDVEQEAEAIAQTPADVDVPEIEDDPGLWGTLITGWKRRIEMGASGTEGNSRTGSFRGSLQLTRKSENHEFLVDSTYQYATRDSQTTQDRFSSNARLDRLMVGSRWRYFMTGSYERDRFRDWDHRWTSGGGFGYQALKDDETSLLARGGMSLAQDIGGLDDTLRTEAILGLDLSHAVSERQKIVGSIDFLPNVQDMNEYRVNAKGGWEILLDPESNLSLRIGGEDRYDATAKGISRRNDLSYYAVIAVEF